MKKETGMYGRRNQWWGWGSPEVGYPLKNREGLVLYLESRLGELQPPVREVSVGAVKVPPPGLTGDEVGQLERMVGRKSVRLEDNVRIIYSFGKSYQDLVRVRNGLVDLVTDAVVFPENEDQIEAILRWAVDRDVAIIPFGGGTSVVGGVERDESSAKTVTVALERLSRVLSIDRTSMTARCQGGITGPELENDLARAGFSLGHFPQSFEYSTLGGWIATRGAGQASTKYGKIEHMVQSVRIVTPEGVVESRSFPAQAAGSDLAQSIVGSEGSLGIITEAVMKIHRTPELCDTRGYLFKDFTAGMETVRQILQAGIVPAIVRLSDREETALSVKLGEFEKGGVDFKQRVGEWYLGRRGFSLTGSCLLILGFEGTRDGVKYERRMGERIIRRGATISLGKSPGESWR
ncbi:MAG: FAD-binding oxidoreductase, partial [Fidelibacterota bacterium]